MPHRRDRNPRRFIAVAVTAVSILGSCASIATLFVQMPLQSPPIEENDHL